MHQLGKEHARMVTFFKAGNASPCTHHFTYDRTSSKISTTAQKVASKSVIDAAPEVPHVVNSNECGVSGDGTWQECGHSSLNGCVSLIFVDSGKVIVVEVFLSTCKSCTFECELTCISVESLDWSTSYTQGHANHTVSAGSMKPVQLYCMLETFETTCNLRYVMMVMVTHKATQL